MARNDSFGILFVCSGNSCRSPMAEGLMKARIPEGYRDRVSVRSAGTLGIYGSPATAFAVTVAKELGWDISQHRSQGTTRDLLKESDIIFAMAPEHKDFLVSSFPEVRENVFLLRSFGQRVDDYGSDRIEDPIGGSLEDYERCGTLIASELDRILPTLRKLIQDRFR